MDLHLQVDLENKALLALRDNLLQLRIEIVRLRDRISPIQSQDGSGHDLSLVATWIERILSGAQRLLPHAAMPRPHQRAVFEVDARRVFGHQADIRLDHRDLALFDHQHGHEFDADEKRIQRVRAIQQRIVLQPDSAAVREERLEVLIVVMEIILVSEEPFDDLSVTRAGRLHFLGIGKSAEPAGNVTGWKRITLECGDDADRVDRRAVLATRLGLDPHQIELLGPQTHCPGGQLVVFVRLAPELRRDGQSIDLALCDDEEAHRMDGYERSRRKYGPLNTLLPAALGEGSEIREGAELGAICRRLSANRKLLPDLRDDDADFTSWNLNPRILLDRVQQPRLPTEARH